MNISRPKDGECSPFYLRYLELPPHDELLTALEHNRLSMVRLFESIPPAIEVFRYDTGKWSIKEVLMHITDFERYLSFKAFVSLRDDNTTILYHPQRDRYLFNAGTEHRTLADLVPEFNTVRAATISMFQSAPPSHLSKLTNHADTAHACSARAYGFCMVGHAIHHMQIIEERYLGTKVKTDTLFN